MTARRKGKLRSYIITREEARRWIVYRAPALRWLKRAISRGLRREQKMEVHD